MTAWHVPRHLHHSRRPAGKERSISTGLDDALGAQERGWRGRPLVRALYEDWFSLVEANLSTEPGLSVELGAGIGRFHERCPWVLATDVERTPWSDEVVDAESLRYGDGELSNLVLIDVFHHLANPGQFLDEATRTLRRGGRVVILDPYCSPVSRPLYHRFHHERADVHVDPFADEAHPPDDPLASNQALATLAFFREYREFVSRWPSLSVLTRQRLALLAYPLSGGLTGQRLVPARLGFALRRLEPVLAPLAPVLAFRCLVVLERC